MKVSGKPQSAATFSAFRYSNNNINNKKTDYSDLNNTATTNYNTNNIINNIKPVRRKTRNPTRLKRTGAPFGKRSRPETPLLKWKIEDRERSRNVEEEEEEEKEKEEEEERESGRRRRSRSSRRRNVKPVSARKLAAGLWRLQLPETVAGGSGGERRRDRLGFQVIFFF